MPHLTDLIPKSTDDTHAPKGEPCQACGAPHDGEDRFCVACGTDLPVKGKLDGAITVDLEEDQKYFRCKNCGAEVATDPDHRSYVCAFCDSTYVVEFSRDASQRQRPEFVIGFTITKEEAQEKFQKWLSSNPWFRPGDLRRSQVVEKLRGVYLPFWSFPMLASSRWSAKIGEHWYRTETYTTRVNGKTVTRTRRVQETEWWPLNGEHHRYYHSFLISGSRGLPQGEAERIKPFYLPALKRYEPYYLAGWLSEEYSIEREKALKVCKDEFYKREQANVNTFMPGDTKRNLNVQTQFSHTSSDLILLPIYILSYQYNEKVYRFLLNGQTGKADGDKPLSGKRISAAIVGVILLIVLAVLLWMGFR